MLNLNLPAIICSQYDTDVYENLLINVEVQYTPLIMIRPNVNKNHYYRFFDKVVSIRVVRMILAQTSQNLDVGLNKATVSIRWPLDLDPCGLNKLVGTTDFY